MIIPGNVNTRQASLPITVPAPIGGLNGRDPLAVMPAQDAYYMDNAFPGTASVDSRKGCAKYTASALGAPVQSLEVYAGGGGDKLLAFAGGKIFDVSTAVPSQLASGLLGNIWITAMFSNSADNAQHLMMVNGLDQPRRYGVDGLNLLTMTGMVGSQNTLNFVFGFKGRLYFGQRDKLGFYYLPVGQLQGALSYFDLGQQSKKGGYLVAIASFSESNNGDSPEDYIAFITNKGEIIVYSGYDPSSAANWALVGRYFTSIPIGQKCTLNYGSELVLLTEEGALAFSDIRRAGSSQAGSTAGAIYSAITSKLGGYLSQYNVNANVPGWQGIQYGGGGGWLLLNVPATSSISGNFYHFVMNTTTNAWCRFTNWNGLCFAVYNKRLYFGRYDGYVMLGDEGRLDDGQPIRWDVKQAYNYFDDGSGQGFLQKHFQWASLLVSCDGEPPLSGKFNVDYTEEQPEYVSQLSGAPGAEWDVDFWDTAVWGDDSRTQRFVVTLNKGGVAGALWLRASLQGLTLSWYATQYVIEKTRGLLI